MKTIIYFFFFILITCFQIENTFAQEMNLHIQYFVDGNPRDCSVSFYSANGLNSLDPIVDGDIQLPPDKMGETFKVEFKFTDAQNKILLPERLRVILNENEDYGKNVFPSLLNSTFSLFITNEKELYKRPNNLSIEFFFQIGYRAKVSIPIKWFGIRGLNEEEYSEYQIRKGKRQFGYASINNKEEPVIKDGYAVQVAVLNSMETQEAFPGLADLGRFYCVKEDVKYKYRLGTYPTVISAGQIKDEAVTRGYKDAFVRRQPEIYLGVSGSPEPSIQTNSYNFETYRVKGGIVPPSLEPSDGILLYANDQSSVAVYSTRPAFISNEYYIQILATRAFQNEQQFGHLRQFGQIYIAPEEGFFKVRIGIFSNRTEAERIINQIRQQYRDAFIVSR
jgi:hypothetical protein